MYHICLVSRSWTLGQSGTDWGAAFPTLLWGAPGNSPPFQTQPDSVSRTDSEVPDLPVTHRWRRTKSLHSARGTHGSTGQTGEKEPPRRPDRTSLPAVCGGHNSACGRGMRGAAGDPRRRAWSCGLCLGGLHFAPRRRVLGP